MESQDVCKDLNSPAADNLCINAWWILKPFSRVMEMDGGYSIAACMDENGCIAQVFVYTCTHLY